MTDEYEPYDDESEDDEPPKPTRKIGDVECDPLTMNCNEMPGVMENLIRKESMLNDGITRIDELRKMFPSRTELDTLHDDALKARERIHGTISDITTRFSMCTLKEEKEEKETVNPSDDESEE